MIHEREKVLRESKGVTALASGPRPGFLNTFMTVRKRGDLARSSMKAREGASNKSREIEN